MGLMNTAIVVLSFNHPQITAKCLTSALQWNVPIVCVHNGSTPENRDLVQRQFPTVEHLILEKNRGYAGGANFGLDHAAQFYEWLVFLTNDCELVGFPLIESTQADIMVPLIRTRSGAVDSAGGHWDRRTGRLKHCRKFDDWTSPDHGCLPYIPGSAFAVRSSTWLALGGFDENLFMYWEDVDWSMRAFGHFTAGPRISIGRYSTPATGRVPKYPPPVRISAAPEFQIRHGVGKTCRKLSQYTVYYYHRNQRWLTSKYPTPIGLRWRSRLHMASAWGRIGLRLVKARRWSDVKLLARALLENPRQDSQRIANQ